MAEDRKYWVPALEKADRILNLIAQEPGSNKLIDLSKQLDMNKSSMFSLLHTMEALQWVKKSSSDTYSLGAAISALGSSIVKQFDLHDAFQNEATEPRDRLHETIQLAKREDAFVLYIGKVEALTPVRLLSEPGMRLPGHATALGKVMLAQLPETEWLELFPELTLSAMTPFTLTDRGELFTQLRQIREQGYALDYQESVVGFRCVAAPIFNQAGDAVAAVSCSMPLHQWEVKAAAAQQEITKLARCLSMLSQ
ncbi:transcriptional regulator [Paenibacillus baekrokdamisoli]|uniref:Transcriptional regulator n=1 Tax=Paenibacillus baekrokdamisoli TaxID=1712516 RepID=A0A3G9ISH1_9BACL|nr:IclR family transcriptional regulator [Paenibacillus baekrokdamisoli]MBB3072661.1 DNA-binding IclR family transcriptional regulator [Paenibacillus baekrokdamisoli]BBH18945.1 transcriptional regulator [Paenibacillus baekrokdamisoli]